MNKKAFRNNTGRRSLNEIFLVGEVIDMGISPKSKGVNVRARLKIRTASKKNTFVYLDVYGRHSCGEVMTLICQTGNIVYVEGEFRNATLDKVNVKPYVLVKHIECLLRRRDVTPPSTGILNVLDDLDPIGYVSNTNPKKRRRRRHENEMEESEPIRTIGI